MNRTLPMLFMLMMGCQGFPLTDQGEHRTPSILPLWTSYQQCLVCTDPPTLLTIADQLNRHAMTGPEPPDWLKPWGRHVQRQPLRTTVDPQALGAACLIRAAQILSEQNHLAEARALYEQVIARYSRQERSYYHEQARDALATLSSQDTTIVVLRDSFPVSNQR